MTMKLKLIFIVMDFITLLAYPLVFVNVKLRQFLKPKEGLAHGNLLAAGRAGRGA
jgi:hypothetical protein